MDRGIGKITSPNNVFSAFKKRNTLLEKVLQDPAREIAIAEENTGGAKYIIDGELRRVPPYYFTYLTFCKERWIGRTLIDVFSAEFRDKEVNYYRSAIAAGQVQVNNKVVDLEYKLKMGDLIQHRTHKHEQPVTAKPIRIVFEDEDMIVIDKPSGVPAHPAGRFKFNSIINILKYEHGIECHPCNRLDRLTSGLMFLAKNPKFADAIGQQIRDRKVRKEYVARVKGEFPAGEVVCEKPVITYNAKVALNMVHPQGKPSKTRFSRISYDGTTSLVWCRPYTGRTHQIRVHLQYLGYPIANDPIYSNPDVWGPDLGREGQADGDEVSHNLDSIGKTKSARSWINQDSGEKLSGEICDVCSAPLYTDPGPSDMNLWLHALRYSADNQTWVFETQYPSWVVDVHRPMMELALEQAKKCPFVDSAFRVGAVLAKDGRVLETGYTRELPGNTHAEQCAIEKYVSRAGPLPEGTILYTTMEPCSLRLSGNLPCVDRILQTPIKTVLVGVQEPPNFVEQNTGRVKLEAAGIHYIHIHGLEQECLNVAKAGHESK